MLNKKIIFLQPAYAHYREELFRLLFNRHSIHYIFEKSKGKYPGNAQPQGIECTFIDKRFKNKEFGLIYYLFKYNSDVIISSVSYSNRTIISFIYSKIFRKKLVLWILEWKKTDYKGNAFKKIMNKIRHQIGIKIILKSDALIVGSTIAKNYAKSIGMRNIFTALQCSNDLKNDLNDVSDFPLKRKAKKNINFLYLGRLVPWKGIKILIHAFHLLSKKNRNVSLIVGGDGPEKNRCMDISRRLKIKNIEFIGPVVFNDTGKVFWEADVFILPSLEISSDYEVWGLTVNEAMSMYLPVITTTRVGAAYDMVVNDYNGFIVQENSVFHLYQAMEKILKCDLKKMGSNSRALFEKLNNYEKMADGFSNAIKSVQYRSLKSKIQ